MTKAALIPLLGAGAGAMLNKDDPMKGAMLGLLGGAVAGPVMGSLPGLAGTQIAGGITPAAVGSVTGAGAEQAAMLAAQNAGFGVEGLDMLANAANYGGAATRLGAGVGTGLKAGFGNLAKNAMNIPSNIMDMSPEQKMKMVAQMQGQGQQQPQAAPAMPPQMGGQPSQASAIAQNMYQRQSAHMGNNPFASAVRRSPSVYNTRNIG